MIAVEPSRTLALSWQDIHQITRIHPRISSRLFENLALMAGDLIRELDRDRPHIRDELSGTYNATYFVDLLEFAADEANRHDNDLSLLGLELVYKSTGENMPNWQDKTRVIRKTTASMRTVLRKGDALSRWKEHLFWVLLPDTNAPTAQMLGNENTAEITAIGSHSGAPHPGPDSHYCTQARREGRRSDKAGQQFISYNTIRSRVLRAVVQSP